MTNTKVLNMSNKQAALRVNAAPQTTDGVMSMPYYTAQGIRMTDLDAAIKVSELAARYAPGAKKFAPAAVHFYAADGEPIGQYVYHVGTNPPYKGAQVINRLCVQHGERYQAGWWNIRRR